ncbi:MAG: amidohydrolase family protein [Acidimicrobiaceae bacterium]|jgi:N-acyl-D-aspartate/D-glutamate deacylase|nr:amidohydrolase family protein [Acidimicrobiaceae bacterium]MBT5579948.1 amidohydrolase family protein [Acidimicrobiaceae bacterium]
MYDEVMRGGTVIDGTGAAGVIADVAIKDGRIAAIGAIPESGTIETDATGKLVTPGFVDPHTHYDAQLLWDPTASPSSIHGVTTVIGGNCGFTLAPLRPGDDDYLRKMMAKVEGMPLKALELGTDWSWESFGDFLDRLDGQISVNAGFLAGHCAIRRYVMGGEAVGSAAGPEDLEKIRAELAKALEAGALGFSFTNSTSHSDGEGEAVASRWATPDELIALAEETGRHEGTTLEGIVPGCLDRFDDDEIELLGTMSAAANRPMNWNVLTVDSREADRVPRQMEAYDRAIELGGKVIALTMPVQVPMNMSLANFCGLFLIPGWGEVLDTDIDERISRLQDPDTRVRLLEHGQSHEAGVFRRLADWGDYIVGDTYSDENEGLSGRRVKDIAAERHMSSFGTFLDISIADRLQTIWWPTPQDDDDESWRMRAELWSDGRAMIGGSDAGAHLDRMCGAPYPTRFIGDCINGRRLTTVEHAVQLMTSDPASLFGLKDRGTLTVGNHADVVMLDPEAIDSGPAKLVTDLPGESARLVADSNGIERVLCNGVAIVEHGVTTGAVPGTLLRSGRDTRTVTAR